MDRRKTYHKDRHKKLYTKKMILRTNRRNTAYPPNLLKIFEAFSLIPPTASIIHPLLATRTFSTEFMSDLSYLQFSV